MYLRHFVLPLFTSYVCAQSTPTTLNATLANNPDLTNLTALLSTSPSLLAQLGNATNITILAPSNAAFSLLTNSSIGQELAGDAGLVNALLQYHILNGSYSGSQISNMSSFVPTLLTNSSYANVTGGQVVEAVKVGNQTVFYSGLLQNVSVTQGDVNFTGGIIHVIDRVLTLPLNVMDTASAANLTSFRGAVNATDLIDAVNDTPDLTIFAPTNEAMQSVGSVLSNISETDLRNILAYHVVNGSRAEYSSDLSNGTVLQSVGGGNLTITVDANGTVFVNAAKVVVPNVLVANGVIHIIDNVLNPNVTAGPSPSATSGAPGFTGASSATDIPFTSGQPTPTTQVNPTSEGPGPASTQPTSGAAAPMRTGSVGVGALFGVGAAVLVAY